MRLKTLILRGFKTFADKTVVEFPAKGITAIVGPNGCGKSNLIDSVLWVLGEGRASELRGETLEEVIFAGSSARKSLSLAEVTLILDNSDNYLPIAYTEVSLKRRIFREGESEFFLNKNPCRLKDIRDLFLDTGLGINSYSIITQGQVDQILSSKPEDRRMVFEEAAQISKYKFRKKEAERKLISTEQNLLRINDLKLELKDQLGILEEQAAKAKRYKALKAELKDLEIGIAKRRIKSLASRKESLAESITWLKLKYEKAEQEIGALKERFKGLEGELNEIRLKGDKSKELEARAREELAVEKERFRSAQGVIKKVEEEKVTLSGRLEKLKGEIAKEEEKRGKVSRDLEGKLKEKAGLENQLEKLKSEISLEERLASTSAKVLVLSDLEKQCRDCEIFKARKKQILSLEGELKKLKEEKDKIKSAESKIEDELKAKEKTSEHLSKELKTSDLTLATLKSEKKIIEEELKKTGKEFEEDLLKRGEERIAALEKSLPKFQEEAGKLNENSSSIERSKEKVLAEIESLEAGLKGGVESDRGLRDELYQKELSLGKLEAEIAGIAEHIYDDYSLTLEELETLEIEVQTVPEARQKVESLKAEMLSLEPVNLLAIEEFEKAKERFNFIEDQSQDLISARADLETLIAELDKKAKESFLKTIEVVGKNFSEIFAKLFEGGEAKLELADSENILESGIEIYARSSGRKMLPLSLLSGGERALTAIAILFALLKTNPSPFCFLDEVDATLDEANILRFTKMLKEFAKSIQMIVVTHSKRTMAMADVLYGITMEEPGISKLISMRLERVEYVDTRPRLQISS